MTSDTVMLRSSVPSVVVSASHNEGRPCRGGRRSTEDSGPPSAPPRFTVITVVRDGRIHLAQCIDSVLAQHRQDVEHIVVDGASTDGTVELLRGYGDRLALWVSEPDAGIYDAMNKGIALARGEIVSFLNADDWYLPGALDAIDSAFGDATVDYAFGDIYVSDARGNLHTRWRANRRLRQALPRQSMPIPHQSLFVRAGFLSQVGVYNTCYRLSADFDLVYRILLKSRRFVQLDVPLAVFREGGRSGGSRTFRETRNIAIAHGRIRAMAYVVFASSLVKSFVGRRMPPRVMHVLGRLKGSPRGAI